MKAIGQIILPEGTAWENEISSQHQYRQDVKHSTTGRVVIQVQRLRNGLPVKVLFPEKYAWLDHFTAKAVIELSQQTDSTFVFQWNGKIFTARFSYDEPFHFESIFADGLGPSNEPEKNLYHGYINLILI